MNNLYYVFTRDAGEFEHDWNCQRYPAADHADALRKAIADGYFKDDAPALVVHEKDANVFTMKRVEDLSAETGAGGKDITKPW